MQNFDRADIYFDTVTGSTAAALRRVREAKERGLPVTCEVTPHHLTLTDQACLSYDTATKCNPPLRTDTDVEALEGNTGSEESVPLGSTSPNF